MKITTKNQEDKVTSSYIKFEPDRPNTSQQQSSGEATTSHGTTQDRPNLYDRRRKKHSALPGARTIQSVQPPGTRLQQDKFSKQDKFRRHWHPHRGRDIHRSNDRQLETGNNDSRSKHRTNDGQHHRNPRYPLSLILLQIWVPFLPTDHQNTLWQRTKTTTPQPGEAEQKHVQTSTSFQILQHNCIVTLPLYPIFHENPPPGLGEDHPRG